jgi:hypothetical protein
MTYAQKTQRIGFAALLLGLLGVMGVAGGVEFLPPDAGFEQWFALLGATFVSLSMMLFGISLMNESME